MVELLAPAGSYDSLRAAVNAGADAVYIGGSMFGARAYADNPDEEMLLRGIDYCHLHGRKLYLTVNTLLKEKELEEKLYEYILPYDREGLDGVIVQDFGVVRFLKKHFPSLPLHASTQMTVTGADSAEILKKEGLTRVVPARELSLKEIRRIITETQLEVETFIHGAMCYCYSGQCLFSSMIGGRSGNRGRCAQPCRLPYQLMDEKGRKNTTYVLSMKDMCTACSLGELIDAGIASFKIEGRMKRPEYTAGVVSIYRKQIDQYLAEGKQKLSKEDQRTLLDLYNRGGFSSGYYHQYNGTEMMSMERPNHFGTKAAKVVSSQKGVLRIKTLEALGKGDILSRHDNRMQDELIVNQSAKEGEVLSLRAGSVRCKEGEILYRMKHAELLETLENQFLKTDQKEKIKGELMISEGSPVILKLTAQGVGVTVCSEQAAVSAMTQPTKEADIRRQMQKTGNTPFEFTQLDIFMSQDLFVPLREINELRRTGLEKLEQAILAKQKRTQSDGNDASKDQLEAEQTASVPAEAAAECAGSSEYPISVLVTTKTQLNAVLKWQENQKNSVSVLYLDLLAAGTGRWQIDAKEFLAKIRAVKKQGMRCIVNLPPVLREKDREMLERRETEQALREADGFLLHTLDELGWVKRHFPNADCIADETFYAYNKEAQQFLREHGVDRLTLPAELNSQELRRLKTENSELVVYGHQAFMQSAQCVQKNTSGCTGVPSVLKIRDRKNVVFPVRNRCVTCCNTIYNSLPLELIDCRKEIDALHPGSLRLSFTIETPEEIRTVLERYTAAFQNDTQSREMEYGEGEGTRGHFRRGVE